MKMTEELNKLVETMSPEQRMIFLRKPRNEEEALMLPDGLVMLTRDDDGYFYIDSFPLGERLRDAFLGLE